MKRFLAVLLLLPLAMVVWMATTTPGFRAGLTLLDWLLPGTLSVTGAQGRLIDQLTVASLHYANPQPILHADSATLEWQPMALFQGKLQIDSLRVQHLAIHRQAATSNEGTASFALPFTAVTIHDAQIARISLTPPTGGTPLILEDSQIQLQANNNALDIARLAISLPEGALEISGHVELTSPYQQALTISGHWQPGDLPPLTSTGTINGAVAQTLRWKQDLEGPLQGTLDFQVQNVLEQPEWRAAFTGTWLDLGLLQPALAGQSIQGELITIGDTSTYSFESHWHSDLPDLGETELRLAGQGTRHGAKVDSLSLQSAGDASLAATASIDLVTGDLSAEGSWQSLAWPPVGTPAIASPEGQFAIEGTLADYRLSLESQFHSHSSGELTVKLTGYGDRKALQLERMTARSPEGLDLETEGEWHWDTGDFLLTGSWQRLRWPPSGEAVISSTASRFHSEGNWREWLP